MGNVSNIIVFFFLLPRTRGMVISTDKRCFNAYHSRRNQLNFHIWENVVKKQCLGKPRSSWHTLSCRKFKDWAPFHYAMALRYWLNENFSDWIRWHHHFEWVPRWPDISIFDVFFLQVYTIQIGDMNHLKNSSRINMLKFTKMQSYCIDLM